VADTLERIEPLMGVGAAEGSAPAFKTRADPDRESVLREIACG